MEEKDWIDYRIEEMEEKADTIQLPKYDMDGCKFCPDKSWHEDPRTQDAYDWSLSNRIKTTMGILLF